MIKLIVAILSGKIIFFLSRLLRLGGGSAAPGLYSLKIEPKLVEKLIKKIPQNIIITGTNGKTTTSRMLSHFTEAQGFKVIRNSTGSNLERGVASTLLSKVSLLGKLNNLDLGIWELDEAAFNKVVFQIKPQIIVFLNAFRDQLDRYGEVDNVVKKWQRTLTKIDWQPTILLNSQDVNTASLATVKNLKILPFGVKNNQKYGERALFPVQKLTNAFEAKIINTKGLSQTRVEVNFNGQIKKFTLPIPGTYHVYDFLAALACYYNLNLDVREIPKHLKHFSPAFGRVEKLKFGYIFLIKNPAGASLVFETIKPQLKKEDRLLIALNDNLADGTDVSWIWDADFERLTINDERLTIFCSGTRAEDLAIRLKYAGFDPTLIVVENNLKMALKEARRGLKGRLFILPTYTAMLQLQRILAKMGIKQHYWREE